MEKSDEPAGFQHAAPFGQGPLHRHIEECCGTDHRIERCRLKCAQVGRVSFESLDVRDARLADRRLRLRKHPGRDVNTDDAPRRTNLRGGRDGGKPGSYTRIQNAVTAGDPRVSDESFGIRAVPFIPRVSGRADVKVGPGIPRVTSHAGILASGSPPPSPTRCRVIVTFDVACAPSGPVWDSNSWPAHN